MRLVGKVPSYGHDEIHVYAADENRVELRIVGARGGTKGAITLSDYGVERLNNLTYQALDEAKS
jgi:hypothetical protein